MKLREYESRSVRDLMKLLPKHKRVVAVGPTGCGKTVIGAALVRKMRGKRVLWLAHRFELLRQAYDQLLESGLSARAVGMLTGVHTANDTARVLVASVDMFRGDRRIPKADLIVVDEAHHVATESYRAILAANPKALVLGLTATPERLDGEPLDAFDHLYIIADAVELQVDGYLLKAIVYGIPLAKARELVKGASGGGKDYSGRKLDAAMRKRPLLGDIVTERERLAKGERTIVYACTRVHGRAIRDRFAEAGVPAAYIDAESQWGERAALLGPDGLLAAGTIQVVVNVGVLTEGFDCPPVSCIIVARPTKSLVLWRQMCGRGARPLKGKRYLVLDHAGNAWRHGFPDDTRAWSLAGREKGTGVAPIKLCPECQAMMPIGLLDCPECGAAQPVTVRNLAEHKAKLERLRWPEPKQREDIIRRLAAQRGLGEEWIVKAMQEIA